MIDSRDAAGTLKKLRERLQLNNKEKQALDYAISEVIDKQNDLIVKYQKALRIAGDDVIQTDNHCVVCRSIYKCDKKKANDLDCKIKFIEGWKEMAGIES